MIQSISLKNFTAFQELTLGCSKGVNVIVGANSTGKSHLLKLLYGVCAANKPIDSKTHMDPAAYISQKLNGVFKPEVRIGRLCRDEEKKTHVRADFGKDTRIEFAFSHDMDEVVVTENLSYETYAPIPVFIPPKEMLSFFEGFSSLYLKRELIIDETYFDLAQALETPNLKTAPSGPVSSLLEKVKETCDGEFLLMKQKKFYYKPNKGRLLEAELAAEGFRKLGMLQQLLKNGHLQPGKSGPLFWDEPESNLNPSLIKQLVGFLLELARNGQQIFLATHDYVALKWFDLLKTPDDDILFHTLFKNDAGEIELNSTDDYLKIYPNAIDDTFAELIDKDIEQSMGDLGK